MKLFKALNAREAQEFRAWARANYVPFSEIVGVWHPVTQMECVIINMEQSRYNEPDEQE